MLAMVEVDIGPRRSFVHACGMLHAMPVCASHVYTDQCLSCTSKPCQRQARTTSASARPGFPSMPSICVAVLWPHSRATQAIAVLLVALLFCWWLCCSAGGSAVPLVALLFRWWLCCSVGGSVFPLVALLFRWWLCCSLGMRRGPRCTWAVVLAGHCRRRWSRMRASRVDCGRRVQKATTVGNGGEAWIGYKQDLRPCQYGLMLSIEPSFSVFFEGKNVVDYAQAVLTKDERRPWEWTNDYLLDNEAREVGKELKGLLVCAPLPSCLLSNAHQLQTRAGWALFGRPQAVRSLRGLLMRRICRVRRR